MRGLSIVILLAACGGSGHESADAGADGAGSDDVSAGLLDVSGFPPIWRGPDWNGGPTRDYAAARGYANGTPVVFLPLPFTTSAQLVVGSSGLGGHGRTPVAYRFDSRCVAPPAAQGDIFTLIPDGLDYVPVVANAPVTSGGEPCDAVKSEATLLTRTDVTVGQHDGTYRVAAILDPRAASIDLPAGYTGPGVPVQHGWFDRYQLSYVDGPAIPTMASGPDTVLVSQNVYMPEQVPDGVGGVAPGTVGSGWSVFEAQLGDASYSPICHVFTYFDDPSDIPTDIDGVIESIQESGIPPTDAGYVVCMQLG